MKVVRNILERCIPWTLNFIRYGRQDRCAGWICGERCGYFRDPENTSMRTGLWLPVWSNPWISSVPIISWSLGRWTRDTARTRRNPRFSLQAPAMLRSAIYRECAVGRLFQLPGLPGGRDQFKPIACMDVKINISNDGHCNTVAATSCA